MNEDNKDKKAFLERVKFRSDHLFAVFTIILIFLPLFLRDPYIINVLIICLMFSVLSASWNLICGYTGIFTFGHQAFYGIGAYVSALLSIKAGVSPWYGLFIAGMVAAFLSFLIGLPCLRLRAAPYIAIATLAFSEIARISCMNLVGLTRGELGLWGIPNFPTITLPLIGEISFTGGARIPYYYLILLIFIISMLFIHFVMNSHIGLAFKAIRDSQEAGESLGINITYYKLMAFMMSAFFAGVVGSFNAHYLLILTPTAVMSVGIMIEIVTIVFVGGLGTFMGPVLSAFLITLGLEYLRFLGEYRFITYGILLILVILFMPQGFTKNIFREKEVI